MNFIVAQIKKDSSPLRGLLIALGCLFAIDVLSLICSLPFLQRVFRLAHVSLSFSGNLTAAVEFVILAILIVRVIHQDSLTDPSAFWRTLPVSRRDLLLAKALLIVPLLCVFTLLTQPWRGVHNDDALDYRGAVVFVAGLAAFATVTPSFSKMVTLFLKIYFGAVLLCLCMAIPLAVIFRYLGVDAARGAVQGDYRHYAQALVDLLLVVCFLQAIVYQYLTLRTQAAVRLISLACGGAIFVQAMLSGFRAH